MTRTMERGTFALSPSAKVPTSCGFPSSVMRKSSRFTPATVFPFSSSTSTSQTTSEVSTRTTSSSSSPSSPLFAPEGATSTARFCPVSHLSRSRLDPKRLSCGGSSVVVCVCARAAPDAASRRQSAGLQNGEREGRLEISGFPLSQQPAPFERGAQQRLYLRAHLCVGVAGPRHVGLDRERRADR